VAIVLAVRRVRAHSALFAALLGVCLLLAALGTGLVGYLGAQARQAVSAGIAALEGSSAELRYDAPTADDAGRQDARARAIIDRELVRAGGPGMPVRVTAAPAANGDDTVWTITPIARQVTPADLPALATVGDRILKALLADAVVGSQGIEKSGTLDEHAAALQVAIAPLAAVEPGPLLLVAAIGLVTLAELGRLLDGVRTRETSLLRSRGASAARVGWTTAAETAVVAGLGAAAGTGVALGVLTAIGSPSTDPVPAASVAVAVVAVAVALVTGVALASARRTFRRGAADETGRVRRLAAPALVLLLVAAAALSLWRFLQFGSPLSPTAAGAEVDPLAVLAPALCLAVVAVAGLALVPVVAAGVERIAARGDGIRATTVAREVSRRVRMIASPFVVIALAGGGIVLAATYQPTWETASTRTAGLHAGADLVVTGTTDVAKVAAVPGVGAAAPVASLSGALQDESTVHVTAVPAAGLVASGTTALGAVDPARLAKDLAAEPAVVPLPATATALTATVAWTGAVPVLTAQLVDASGLVAEAAFSVPSSSPAVVSARLPGDGVARALVALDAQLQPVGAPGELVEVSGVVSAFSVVAGGEADDLLPTAPWTLSPGTTINGQATASGPLGYAGQLFSATGLRLQPADATAVPVVLSRAFARTISAHVGETPNLDIGVVPGSFPAKVAAIVDQVPGSPGNRGLLVDLRALQVATLRAGGAAVAPTGIWASSADPVATASRIRAAVPGSTVAGPRLGTSVEVLASVPRALWAGMIGGAVLALVALGAVAGELLRMRADEVVVLRALGMPPRRLAGMRRLELGVVAGAAVVVALVGGAATSFLLVPGLARAAVLGPFAGAAVPLHVDALGLGLSLAGVIVAIAAILAGYGAQVRRQAVTLPAAEVTR